MQVIYAGKPPSLSDAEQKKVQARIAKISKLVDGRGEKELHVFFQTERHLIRAEVTLNYYGHAAVGIATGPEAFPAFAAALDKLEKQVVKMRAKWRDTKRTPAAKQAAAPPPEPVAPAVTGPRISRVTVRRKPMTVDEALLVIGPKAAYLPFRDVETGAVSVLIRRGEGQFDLVES
jgi:putative sigma-54 modulation protein